MPSPDLNNVITTTTTGIVELESFHDAPYCLLITTDVEEA